MANKTLQEIAINDIFPNPDNPRLIFNPEDLEDLKESIRKAGVLVPVTVYENDDPKSEAKYIILDGERRWRCAKELNKPTIPANILDKPKDVTQNILYMFNIHYFRKQWELFPTAAKLEKIIELIGTDKDSVLSSTTGLSLQTVKRCKILLWYPVKYRETMLYKRDKISTDFFIELYPIVKRIKEEPEFNNDLKISKIIDGLIDKFTEAKSFSDVKEFREIRKCLTYYDTKEQFFEFKNILLQFIEESSKGMDVFTVTDIETEKIKGNVLKNISYLLIAFNENPPEIFSDITVIDQMTALRIKIEQLLLKVE